MVSKEIWADPSGRAARVCGCSLAGIVGSNPASGMDVCLLWVLSGVRYSSLRWADHSSRGFLPIVVCLTEGNHKSSIKGCLGPQGLLSHGKKGKSGILN
jgi:hypothetical protein